MKSHELTLTINHPLPQVVLTYSYRNATNGSTFVARRAGR
jgi:hypothetical protein